MRWETGVADLKQGAVLQSGAVSESGAAWVPWTVTRLLETGAGLPRTATGWKDQDFDGDGRGLS